LVGDTTNTWRVIVWSGPVLSVVGAFLFVWLTGRFAGLVVWTLVWTLLLLLVCCSLASLYKAGVIEGDRFTKALDSVATSSDSTVHKDPSLHMCECLK